MAAGLQERLHRHPGVGVDLHKADPLLASAFGAAGEIVREDGLAAGTLQFPLDPYLGDRSLRDRSLDQPFAAKGRLRFHAAASVALGVRECCMNASRAMTIMPTTYPQYR